MEKTVLLKRSAQLLFFWKLDFWIDFSIPESLKSLNSWIYCDSHSQLFSSSAWSLGGLDRNERATKRATNVNFSSKRHFCIQFSSVSYFRHAPTCCNPSNYYCNRGLAHLLPSRPKYNRVAGHCFLYLATRSTDGTDAKRKYPFRPRRGMKLEGNGPVEPASSQ